MLHQDYSDNITISTYIKFSFIFMQYYHFYLHTISKHSEIFSSSNHGFFSIKTGLKCQIFLKMPVLLIFYPEIK